MLQKLYCYTHIFKEWQDTAAKLQNLHTSCGFENGKGGEGREVEGRGGGGVVESIGPPRRSRSLMPVAAPAVLSEVLRERERDCPKCADC